MSTTYEPGTVAVIRDKNDPSDEWRAVKDDKGWSSLLPNIGWVHDSEVDVVRPLVVLDIPQDVVPSKMAASLRECSHVWLADQIEGQTKAPKPAEPTGLGAVVESADGRKYVRTAKTDFPWVDAANPGENAYHWTEWGGLPTPPVRVISEGVES